MQQKIIWRVQSGRKRRRAAKRRADGPVRPRAKRVRTSAVFAGAVEVRSLVPTYVGWTLDVGSPALITFFMAISHVY